MVVPAGPADRFHSPGLGPARSTEKFQDLLKVGGSRAENLVMMSHEVFEYQSRRTPRRTLRIAPFVVLIALAAYATVVVAALTAPSSAESGSPAQPVVQVVESAR